MSNQALQYDNGKFYYIEGGSTRIEVAPESEDTAMDLLFTFREENYELKEGIYPVQVKVNYKYTKKPPYRYAILSELEKVEMCSEELGYEGDSKSTKELIKEIWELWESMAESGELHIGPQFSANYKRLKAQIRQLSDIITERTHLLVRANEQISELDLANKMYKQDLEEAEKRIKELKNVSISLREVIANREDELDGAVKRIKELEQFRDSYQKAVTNEK